MPAWHREAPNRAQWTQRQFADGYCEHEENRSAADAVDCNRQIHRRTGDVSNPAFLFIAGGLIFWVSKSFKASQAKGWASIAVSVVIGYLSFMFAS
jgi:hypothetical protein